ncbi:MAG: YicC/YloC family endoribonuclease [Candidatus Neomarinimicrobiota bacterium]|nr:MAG: YicC family protein [Candidatus Marinimicrobia bacterium TMED108]|tara:strand:- start:890 stop:1750 length:861 start_codon:yes stop_codon:yes gene_type:complete
MIQSMTGFGRSSAGRGNNKISVSIRCVNGKVLDLKIRGLDLEYSLEKSIRDMLSEKIIRGTVHINFESDSSLNSQDFIFNESRLKLLITTLATIEKKYGHKLNINEIITSNDLFMSNESKINDSKLILRAIRDASNKVIKMRKTEGAVLKDDILKRIALLKKILSTIEKQIPLEHKKRIKKLKNRISDLLKDFQVDDLRMNQEIAHLVDKADITEEVVRLKSHFLQFEKIVRGSKPAGKSLNFLLQEISREINTIGSKSFSDKVVKHVIGMKEESEKIREQIQNIL